MRFMAREVDFHLRRTKNLRMKRWVVQLSARALFDCSRRGNEAVCPCTNTIARASQIRTIRRLPKRQKTGAVQNLAENREPRIPDRFWTAPVLWRFFCVVAALALSALTPSLFAADLGSFEGQTDIGHVTHSGSVEFDPGSKS